MHTNYLQKNIGLVGLSFAGMTCMIGSGWLFGAYKAVKLAGPGAIFAWLIGGAAILCIALTYGWDRLAVAISALSFFVWGINNAWLTPTLQKILSNKK